MDSIPVTVRQLRRALDLTQQQLAERMEVGGTAVPRWEQGTATPSPPALAKLYQLAREADRLDLAGVFARGPGPAAIDTRMPAELVLQRLPAIDQQLARAASILSESLFAVGLARERRGALVGSAVEILIEARETIARILREAHSLPETTT